MAEIKVVEASKDQVTVAIGVGIERVAITFAYSEPKLTEVGREYELDGRKKVSHQEFAEAIRVARGVFADKRRVPVARVERPAEQLLLL